MRAIRRPKRLRLAERGVERQHGHRVGPADAGGERRDGAAEHVDVGVVLAEHRPAGHRVLALGDVDVGREPRVLEHARPQLARGTELGDGRELLVRRGVAELDQVRGVGQVESRGR